MGKNINAIPNSIQYNIDPYDSEIIKINPIMIKCPLRRLISNNVFLNE
jgi:hypothetical protein